MERPAAPFEGYSGMVGSFSKSELIHDDPARPVAGQEGALYETDRFKPSIPNGNGGRSAVPGVQPIADREGIGGGGIHLVD